ncbi:MAG: signal peptide peptidase SppA [Anaerovorax sp.]|nr:signal peptide peptidase SppA [Anaerovorax sp.]
METNMGNEEMNMQRTMVLQEKPKKKKRIGLWIFLGILALFILIVVGAFFLGDDSSYSYAVDEPYIATIYVEGTIASSNVDSFGVAMGYQHNWTLEQLDYLMTDENNKGLIVFVNSPGGGVYESDELYLKIKDYQKETGNPVYAAMGNMAASGGYYISAPADKIFANRNTWTGSIGVTMGTLFDVSDVLKKYGIKTNTITSGANKAMGSPVEPMTEEQRAIFQSLVDEAYEQFTSIVSTERDIPMADTKKLADGRIYTAKQALKLKLVDKIGTYEEALDDMCETYDLYNCEQVDVIYEDNSLFGSLMADSGVSNMLSSIVKLKSQSDVTEILGLVKDRKDSPVSYLCDYLK